MKTVKQVADLAGVSVRTLHYYDQIGLLKPSDTTHAGYRLYGEEELHRLQEILFFRELGFELRDIDAILHSPAYSREQALVRQRTLLAKKRDRLDGLINQIDGLIKGERDMDLSVFRSDNIEETKQMYKSEVLERWGNTNAYQQSESKTANYQTEDWQRMQEEMQTLVMDFSAAMNDGPPESEQAQATTRAWQMHITQNYYECTDELLAGLGQMYEQDERFAEYFDRVQTGLSAYVAAAIRAHCAK